MIKIYSASADTTITNAFKSDLITRGTGSNMGASDILEVFSIYGQGSTTSVEKARAMVQFDVSKIKAALKDYSDDDYILCIGDPAAIGIAIHYALMANRQRVNILKWDRREYRYYPVEVET